MMISAEHFRDSACLSDLADLAASELLSEAAEVEALLREAEVHRLRLAYQWAVAHPALNGCETPHGPALPTVRLPLPRHEASCWRELPFARWLQHVSVPARRQR